jgi:hypothetical protein
MKPSIYSGKTILILLLIIAGFISCEKIETGKEFNLKIGEKHYIGLNLSFTLDSIREYRCPTGLLCFWAGDVDLFFSINKPFQKINKMTNLYNSEKNPFTAGGYTWKVLEVNPYPKANVPVDPKDIRIKMIITKD